MGIRVLEPAVIARIAAGEVVERPASVVKELVENSLDAGATQITIEVRGGGTNLIRVIDNGRGIPPEDLDAAFRRHATSKITGLEDLDSIGTLGFRGEALPSIAAVAEVEVITSADGTAEAACLSLKEGMSCGRGKRGRSRGTTITVRGLFRSVPARLKFLKSAATENARIAEVVTRYALAYPEVRFSLLIEGRVSLSTPGTGRLVEAVAQVYGPATAGKMLNISPEPGWESGPDAPRVTGLVGAPEVSRATRDYLSFYVNRRWVTNRLLGWAVGEAYHGLLMAGRHPVAALNIAVPPGEVDVNVHPAKTEVRFRNEGAVITAVQRAVRRTLIGAAPVPRIEEVAVALNRPPGTAALPWAGSSSEAPSTAPTPAAALPVLRVLGQFMTTYIAAEGPDGLYIIDQHAAHERIIFEQIMEQWAERKVETQGLLEPVTLELSPVQAETLRENLDRLAEFGFGVEPFGDRACLVRAVPARLHGRDWLAALRELAEAPPAGEWGEEMARLIACHGAIRAGQILGTDEMRELCRQLEHARLPNSCPHGRPTIMRITRGRFEREFGRTG